MLEFFSLFFWNWFIELFHWFNSLKWIIESDRRNLLIRFITCVLQGSLIRKSTMIKDRLIVIQINLMRVRDSQFRNEISLWNSNLEFYHLELCNTEPVSRHLCVHINWVFVFLNLKLKFPIQNVICIINSSLK